MTDEIDVNVPGNQRHAVTSSLQARVALWVGIVNSGGLMILGAYCLKLSVDHLALPLAAVTLGALGPLMVWGVRGRT